MQPPPYPEKHRGKPLRDKKDCREKKRTAEEKESLLAGRGGNSNGTRKAAGGEKRTAEKRESRQVGRQSRHWAAKRVQKKAGGNPFPNCQKEQKRPFRGLVGAGKFYYLYAALPKPFRYGPNIRYIPDRHGAAGLGGLRCPAFFRSRIRLSLQPQIRAARAQQDRLGADGVARIRGYVRAVAALRKDVGSRAADALRALSGPLPATGVHLPAAHARRVENAARHRRDGHVLQHAQRPDAGRVDLLRLARRLLRRLVSRNLIFISAGRCSSREWP